MRLCLKYQVAISNSKDILFYLISTMDRKVVRNLFFIATLIHDYNWYVLVADTGVATGTPHPPPPTHEVGANHPPPLPPAKGNPGSVTAVSLY